MEWLLLVSGLVLSVISAPAPINKEDLALANDFMFRFGYLELLDRTQAESLVRVEQAVKDVQRFGGLPQTGELDNSTLQLMKSPRCGLPDFTLSSLKRRRRNGIRKRHSGRTRRYILGPTLGWTKRLITYFIANWSPKIGKSAMKAELQKALDIWAKYGGNLRFQEVNSPDADIIVAFGSGDHGDGYPFDGPGTTLAHAFFPGEQGSLGGDIHFDNDETWKINPGEFDDGVDFFTVAVHEVGHSLGLSHSPEHGSVMNPYYKQFDSESFSLSYDDILGMYDLYITKQPADGGNGFDEDSTQRTATTTTTTRRPTTRINPTTTRRPTTTRKPTTTRRPTTQRPTRTTTERHIVTYVGDDESVDVHKTHDSKHGIPDPVLPQTPLPPLGPQTTPSSTEIPDACDGYFSAVSFLRGELFIFKGNYMWRLREPGRIITGYPVPTDRMFQQLPQRIDAAYERGTDSNLIFFSGDKYWVSNGNELVENSPRSIHDYGLPEYVKRLDAVMVWGKNKKTYLFSGNQYWRFNESSRSMDPNYPKAMRLFKGVPPNLDSAMTWSDGITYFFKNNLYWAFNNTWLKTEPFYPQDASKYWLGCH